MQLFHNIRFPNSGVGPYRDLYTNQLYISDDFNGQDHSSSYKTFGVFLTENSKWKVIMFMARNTAA